MSWFDRLRERFASDPELVAIRQRLEAKRQHALRDALNREFWLNIAANAGKMAERTRC